MDRPEPTPTSIEKKIRKIRIFVTHFVGSIVLTYRGQRDLLGSADGRAGGGNQSTRGGGQCPSLRGTLTPIRRPAGLFAPNGRGAVATGGAKRNPWFPRRCVDSRPEDLDICPAESVTHPTAPDSFPSRARIAVRHASSDGRSFSRRRSRGRVLPVVEAVPAWTSLSCPRAVVDRFPADPWGWVFRSIVAADLMVVRPRSAAGPA